MRAAEDARVLAEGVPPVAGAVMAIEGVVTVFCVAFLRKVKPEMLPGYDAAFLQQK